MLKDLIAAAAADEVEEHHTKTKLNGERRNDNKNSVHLEEGHLGTSHLLLRCKRHHIALFNSKQPYFTFGNSSKV